MSLHLPSRQACCRSSNALSQQLSGLRISSNLPFSQRRNASAWDWLKRSREKKQPTAPTVSVAELMKSGKPTKAPPPQAPQPGGLQGDSIFGPEETTGMETSDKSSAKQPYRKDTGAMAAAVDPKPWARARWQRKKMIQSIQHRGRLSRTEQILKQERQHIHSTGFFKTSIKKTIPLTRQIAGKTVEEALVQLRFSKKLAAKRLADELRMARDEAIVTKGMGLGHIKTIPGENGAEPTREVGTEVAVPFKDKNGKTRMVKPTTMYIDQAWVNRGKFNLSREYRARGKVNMLLHPHTMVTFMLKEEKTRLRIAKKKEDEKAKARPWVHHPDRNINNQAQYILCKSCITPWVE